MDDPRPYHCNSEYSLNQHSEAADQGDRLAQTCFLARDDQHNECKDDPTPRHREKGNLENRLQRNRQIRCMHGRGGDLLIREAMHGGSHKQHNATQRDQRARHGTASNHLIWYFIVRKNAVVVAERVGGCLKNATASIVAAGKWAINGVLGQLLPWLTICRVSRLVQLEAR
jgi:hypothetical protein